MHTIKFLLLLFCLSLAGQLNAQDKLLDKKGEETLVKVLEISPDTVYYKLFPDSTATAIYATPKASLFMVTYQNGTKEVFGVSENRPANGLTSLQLYQQGQADAKKYFKSSGVYWATLGGTLFTPPVGFGVGIGASLTNPRTRNMITPNVNLLQEPAYVKGYQNQAKKKKLGSAAGGFGTVVGAYTILIFALLAAYVY